MNSKSYTCFTLGQGAFWAHLPIIQYFHFPLNSEIYKTAATAVFIPGECSTEFYETQFMKLEQNLCQDIHMHMYMNGVWSQGDHSKYQAVVGMALKLDRVHRVQMIFSESILLSSTVLYNNKQCMSCS